MRKTGNGHTRDDSGEEEESAMTDIGTVEIDAVGPRPTRKIWVQVGVKKVKMLVDTGSMVNVLAEDDLPLLDAFNKADIRPPGYQASGVKEPAVLLGEVELYVGIGDIVRKETFFIMKDIKKSIIETPFFEATGGNVTFTGTPSTFLLPQVYPYYYR